MMERPSTSSTGIYAGRQWLMGVGYKGIFADQLGYAVNIMSLTHAGMPIKGSSYGGRLFWVPRSQEGDTLHFGFSYSIDTEDAESLLAKVVDIYGDGAVLANPLVPPALHRAYLLIIARLHGRSKQLMRLGLSTCKENTQP